MGGLVLKELTGRGRKQSDGGSGQETLDSSVTGLGKRAEVAHKGSDNNIPGRSLSGIRGGGEGRRARSGKSRTRRNPYTTLGKKRACGPEGASKR